MAKGMPHIMRTVITILILLSFLLLVQILPAVERISVQKILSNPDKYDGQEVTIQGKATKIKPRTSKRGNDYTTFTLRDESGKTMSIFTRGHPLITEKQKVTVTGIYKKVKKVRRHTFHNEVEARNINR